MSHSHKDGHGRCGVCGDAGEVNRKRDLEEGLADIHEALLEGPQKHNISDLLAKEMLIHPPTSRAEVYGQYVALLDKFVACGISHGEVEEAVQLNLVNDSSLLEEWIFVRQAMDALGMLNTKGK